MAAIDRYLLLADWSNESADVGSHLFKFGKGIGIVGRALQLLLAVAAVVGALVTPLGLALVAYGAGFALVILVAIEVLARSFMLGGNAISFRNQQRKQSHP